MHYVYKGTESGRVSLVQLSDDLVECSKVSMFNPWENGGGGGTLSHVSVLSYLVLTIGRKVVHN